ncbi:MAG: methyltransferase domain-containing protein [Candidatus Aminicenantes bacterium]|nr:MAG: methyltransferase domain-containing protein [Candidatus Aminicenantes bacterium]
MRRTLEKLAQKRKEKEADVAKKLKEIKEKSKEDPAFKSPLRLKQLLSQFEETLKSEDKILVNQQALLILKEFQSTLEQSLNQITGILSSLTDLIELNTSLADAKDREWDALGSNHVGMIFKSMEWKVDKLAAEYEDVKILMKKFLHLKENLNQLHTTLEKKKIPSPPQVREILEPLEDWRYTAFENRFRGKEEEVKKQQAIYLPYFKNIGKVLDLGCGRGEFMELLKENGIQADGVDINGQMIDICRDKGLSCTKGDILEKLAEFEDGTLGGIFSSQVIEHLPPPYLMRTVELAYFKLASSGCIVFETINPTSVFTLVQIYFLDFSHQKPIHPQMLRFLLENAGFEEVEIKYSHPLEQERLQNLPGADEMTSLINQNIDNLNKLLYSSPNYAAIAKKP